MPNSIINHSHCNLITTNGCLMLEAYGMFLLLTTIK